MGRGVQCTEPKHLNQVLLLSDKINYDPLRTVIPGSIELALQHQLEVQFAENMSLESQLQE
ncbi:MAG: hypothetical protein NTV30_07035, partial [Chloroflexi bacterium]|nr:hypothetical protein [Chloroflexota bacterium]